MNIIYTPSGRALEYSPLAVNLYRGCLHGCDYCYAPACLRQTRTAYHADATPRENILTLLQKDARALQAKQNTDRVLLCFTTDPYQGDSDLNITTRHALQILQQHAVPFQVLTKGGMKAVRDFDLYGKDDAFAVSLTFDDDIESRRVEPCAALPSERVKSLWMAKERGITTWVSFEPVLDADAVFRLIDATHEFVDLYKIGKCSGNFSRVTNWRAFGLAVSEKLTALNKDFYLKEDLRKCL